MASFLEETGRLALFSRELLLEVLALPGRLRRGLRHDLPLFTQQMAHIGADSLPVVLITALFTGMVLALQASVSLEQVLKGISLFIGRTVALPFIRELGPVLTALIVTGRIGSAIAAEIGTMQVTEQVDALKTLATPPVRYLGVPRFVACVLMLPLLTAIADVVGVLGGWLVARNTLGISSSAYFSDIPMMVRTGDVWEGLAKAPVFGGIIALVSCYQGFSTRGGAEGVGRATTAAVVWSSMLILVSDYVLTAVFVQMGL